MDSLVERTHPLVKIPKGQTYKQKDKKKARKPHLVGRKNQTQNSHPVLWIHCLVSVKMLDSNGGSTRILRSSDFSFVANIFDLYPFQQPGRPDTWSASGALKPVLHGMLSCSMG